MSPKPQDVHYPVNGVGFEYGKSTPSQEAIEVFDGDVRAQALNSTNKIHIWAYASDPGAEDFNQSLSEKRAQWTADYLESIGVDPARIEIHAMGEGGPITHMAESVEVDHADQRVAILEFERPVQKVEKNDLQTGFGNHTGVPDDLNDKGREGFAELVDPQADFVRRDVPIAENPIIANPTGDLGKDAWEFAKFMGIPDLAALAETGIVGLAENSKGALAQSFEIKNLFLPGVNTAAKLIAGSFINLANMNQAKDIKAGRMELYEAIAGGIAAGLDSDYLPPGYEDFNEVQMELFQDAKAKVLNMSGEERTELAVYLISESHGLVADGYSDARWLKELGDGGSAFYDGATKRFHFPEFSTNSSKDDEGEYEPGAEAKHQSGDGSVSVQTDQSANSLVLDPTEIDDGAALASAGAPSVLTNPAHAGMSLLHDAGISPFGTMHALDAQYASDVPDGADPSDQPAFHHVDADAGMCLLPDNGSHASHDVAEPGGVMNVPGSGLPHSGSQDVNIPMGSQSQHNQMSHNGQVGNDASNGHAHINSPQPTADIGHMGGGGHVGDTGQPSGGGLTHQDGGMDLVTHADVVAPATGG